MTVRDLEVLLGRYAKHGAATGFARANGLELPPNRYNLAWSARQNKLLPTLASAWHVDGRVVEGSLLAEAEEHRRRSERYGKILDDTSAHLSGGVKPFKGAVIAELYPTGWVRRTGDLDLEVSGTDKAVALGRFLQDQGWKVIRLTVFQDHGHLYLALNIVNTCSGNAIIDFDWVQLQGFGFRGDPWRLPPRVDYNGRRDLTLRARTLLALVEEVSQRRILARDIFDFALLVGVLDAPEWSDLSMAVTDLGLSPESGKLNELAVALGLLQHQGLLGIPTTGNREELWRRRALSTWRRALVRVYRSGHDADMRLFQDGFPMSGAPDISDRARRFTVNARSGSGVHFAGPLGSGQLRFHATI